MSSHGFALGDALLTILISVMLLPAVTACLWILPQLTAFDESIQPFFAEIRNLRAENDRLATVRDSMLPRLMSGELDVSELDF